MNYPNEDEYCPPGSSCMKALLYRSFGLFWEHKKLLVSAQLVLLAIMFVGDYLLQGVGGNVLLGPFFLGVYKINLAIARNRETELGDILAGFENFLPAFIINIVVHLAFVAGLFLLVVPGLIVLITYAPVYLILLDKNPGIWDAMEDSRKLVWGNKKLWGTLGAWILAINFAGLLCFVVGLVVTLTYTHLLIAMVYEEEKERLAAQPTFGADPADMAQPSQAGHP